MERYLTLSGIHDFVQQVARYGSVIPHGSVHLDARMISPRCGMKCGGFCAYFFVQRVARYGERYSIIVACILMHERTTHGTLFTIFRIFTISCNELHATSLHYIHTIPQWRIKNEAMYRLSSLTFTQKWMMNKKWGDYSPCGVDRD